MDVKIIEFDKIPEFNALFLYILYKCNTKLAVEMKK